MFNDRDMVQEQALHDSQWEFVNPPEQDYELTALVRVYITETAASESEARDSAEARILARLKDFDGAEIEEWEGN